MGIPTDPATDQITSTCGCYAGDTMPTVVIAIVTGIITGNNHNPAVDPPPPNGWWYLDHQFDCVWGASHAGCDLIWNPRPAVANVFDIDVTATGKQVFFNNSGEACGHLFTNEQDTPIGNFYYGGNVGVFDMTHSTPYSLKVAMDLLGIPVSSKTFAHPNMFNGDTIMHRFANIRDNMNIKIKQQY